MQPSLGGDGDGGGGDARQYGGGDGDGGGGGEERWSESQLEPEYAPQPVYGDSPAPLVQYHPENHASCQLAWW